MKALLIDAYDSFVYVIYQYLQILEIDVEVVRNDKLSSLNNNFDFIVLGPGPGHPRNSNYHKIIDNYKNNTPILGICLGHQAIGDFFGATIEQAKHLVHGKTSTIDNDGLGCFRGLPKKIDVTRYHSLIVSNNNLPNNLQISAISKDDGYIMAMRHTKYRIESVQFHPESITTEFGLDIIKNFVNIYINNHNHSKGHYGNV